MIPSAPARLLLSLKSRTNHWGDRLRRRWMALRGAQLGAAVRLGVRFRCTAPHRLSIGSRTLVQRGVAVEVTHPFDDGPALAIGSGCFVGQDSLFIVGGRIEIGDGCLLAARCLLVDVGHAIVGREPVSSQPSEAKPIVIGRDVWLGAGCTVLPGVTIGDGCVVAAGAVVHADLPAFGIYGGVPAKLLRMREPVSPAAT